MTAFSANPSIYIFMAFVLLAVVGYYAYAAYDRTGLDITDAVATVTGKQYNPPGTTYVTNIAGGRAWTQSNKTAETHVVTLLVGTEPTAGLVTKQLYDELNAGDKVKVKLRRTRVSKRLEAVEVTR